MKKKTGDYQIPFDNAGNQLDYPIGAGALRGMKWADNYEFVDSLTLINYGRGRSSITFEMERADKRTVSVFVSDFFDMVKKMNCGIIRGKFTFIKKGSSYGCRLVKE